MIQLDAVGYWYPRARRQPALDDISVELLPGLTGLVGLNGAGKSTLLRILLGGLFPRSGSVQFESERSSVGFVPQSGTLPRGFSARDFLAYGSWLQGHRPAPGAIDAVLDAVQLRGKGDQAARSLSGGQQRRLLFANAVLPEPSLLLLDEPTAGLDPQQRLVMRELIRGSEVAHTVLSTHLLEDIVDVADNLIILRSGRLAYAGDAAGFLQELEASEGDLEAAFVRYLADGEAS